MNTSIELKNVIKELSEANEALFRASVGQDDVLASKIMDQIALLENRRNRLFKAARSDRTEYGEIRYENVVPLRDQVIRALHMVNCPAAGKLIADVTKSLWNESIDTKKLSSLRRDESRSWKAGQDGTRRTAIRDVYIVPALTYDRFAPVRGVIALSTWQLSERLIAPLSPRANLLKSTIALAKEAMDKDVCSQPDALVRLVQRLGSSIPGVNKFDSSLADILSSAREELAQIEDIDHRERQEGAKKASNILNEEACLFGSTLKVIHNDAMRGA